MPICQNCNSRVEDSFQFCPHCGSVIAEKSLSVDESFTWEYCEIVWSGTKKGGFWTPLRWRNVYFWASAVGKKGTYCAGESPTYDLSIWKWTVPPCGYTDEDNEKAASAHHVLVNALINDGWEPTNSIGTQWWNQKLRRKAK